MKVGGTWPLDSIGAGTALSIVLAPRWTSNWIDFNARGKGNVVPKLTKSSHPSATPLVLAFILYYICSCNTCFR